MCYLDGRMVAEKLHNQGYTRLILVSGEDMPNPPPYLAVVLKSEQDKLASLDKVL